MQELPTGYGPTPQWSGQQQSNSSGVQWNQQPYAPYPPLQEFAPQQPFPPQQGQFQQPFPQVQYNQQAYRQPPAPQAPPKQPKTRVNIVKSLVWVSAILIAIILLIFVFVAIAPKPGNNAVSTMSEPDFKASTTDTTVANIDKDSNQDKGMNVHFTATILNFVKDSNGNTAGANVDNGLAGSIIQVAFPSGTDLSKLNTGDTIEVWGVDEGSFSGNNAFGATVQEVAVVVAYMTDQTTGYQAQ